MISLFILIQIVIISIVFSYIINVESTFLKNMILFEVLFLAIIQLFLIFSLIVDSIAGVIFSLMILGVVAAETAVGLTIFIVYSNID